MVAWDENFDFLIRLDSVDVCISWVLSIFHKTCMGAHKYQTRVNQMYFQISVLNILNSCNFIGWDGHWCQNIDFSLSFDVFLTATITSIIRSIIFSSNISTVSFIRICNCTCNMNDRGMNNLIGSAIITILFCPYPYQSCFMCSYRYGWRLRCLRCCWN